MGKGHQETANTSNESRGCGLIVVVEDDHAIREILQAAIESEGYVVRTASNGEEAFSLLKELQVP